jgi:hypothetical protein
MQIGSAIGLAALVSLGTSHATVLEHAGIGALTATASGYALSFSVAAGVTGFGALLAFLGIRQVATTGRPKAPEAQTAAREPVATGQHVS